MRRRLAVVLAIQAKLLALYPKPFRAEFESEMREVFAEAADDSDKIGAGALVCLLSREVLDLPGSAAREHLAWIRKGDLVGGFDRRLRGLILGSLGFGAGFTLQFFRVYAGPPNVVGRVPNEVVGALSYALACIVGFVSLAYLDRKRRSMAKAVVAGAVAGSIGFLLSAIGMQLAAPLVKNAETHFEVLNITPSASIWGLLGPVSTWGPILTRSLGGILVGTAIGAAMRTSGGRGAALGGALIGALSFGAAGMLEGLCISGIAFHALGYHPEYTTAMAGFFDPADLILAFLGRLLFGLVGGALVGWSLASPDPSEGLTPLATA